MSKGKILVAAVEAGQARAKRVLEPEFEVELVNTLREARQRLSAADGARIAALIVGIHFDDSRGLDLVSFVCKDERWNQLPIIVLQELPFKTGDMGKKAAEWSRRLGVSTYVKTLGNPNGDEELKAAVLKYLDNHSRRRHPGSSKDI